MQTKQKSPSERFKRKVLMRWRWLRGRGMSLEQAAVEIGVTTGDLRRWSRGEGAEAPLIVPVQVEAEPTSLRGLLGGRTLPSPVFPPASGARTLSTRRGPNVFS